MSKCKTCPLFLLLEEKIICFADKLFSKDNEPLKEKPIRKIREFIGMFGEDKLRQFDERVKMFMTQ